MIFTSATCQETSGAQTLHSFIAYEITILSEEQRVPVDCFISTFLQTLHDREKLKSVFDISDRPSIEFAEYVKEYIFNVLTALEMKKAEMLADFATRPLKQNLKSFSLQSMITVYTRLVVLYLNSERYLTQDSCKDLALKWAEYMESNANVYVVQGDASTKFLAITNGFMEFVMSFNDSNNEFLTPGRAAKLSILYESLWLLTAVQTSNSNDLYTKCISESNGDSNDSKSGSDSSSSESTGSNSGPDSSSSESPESSSGSDSCSSESIESNSGSDSATCRGTIDKQMVYSFVAFDVTILFEEQRVPVDSFISTFVEAAYGQEWIDVFDISDTPPFDFAEYVENFIQNTLTASGVKEPHVHMLPDFATRPLKQNFNSLSRQSMITVYARLLAFFLYSEGKMTQDNAKDLALKSAEYMESNANAYVVQGDTSTKFVAITNGFMEFVMSFKDSDNESLTFERAVQLSILYESLWSMRAAETESLNDLYIKCIFEFNGYVSDSNSASDSGTSESIESNSGPVSSSSEPVSSSSE
ncbi:uncharacterized protein TNIN_118721 [Trichonephila inaurata madagascariensis]|uniref:Uncharacterized protein n=1 Tax=Trichonephila inaurata madagascariensis TaxID=2747483 RepID=A0A8X6YSM1_9ARAC|nr:uncharacterized protein TNIN_118721 [Trichonephila inaurata madagascariensis]